MQQLQANSKFIRFCWVPSHVGVPGNERADIAAKSASTRPEEFIPVDFRDWFPHITEAINRSWSTLWERTGQKLQAIVPNVGVCLPHPETSRRDEVVLNRVRAGHSLATHGYLMNTDGPRVPPVCPYCNNALLSIKHIFLDCVRIRPYRDFALSACSTTHAVTLQRILGETCIVREVLEFLKDIDLYQYL